MQSTTTILCCDAQWSSFFGSRVVSIWRSRAKVLSSFDQRMIKVQKGHKGRPLFLDVAISVFIGWIKAFSFKTTSCVDNPNGHTRKELQQGAKQVDTYPRTVGPSTLGSSRAISAIGLGELY